MPFVNIRLVEGRSQQLKYEMSKRVIAAISDVLQLPEHDIWIVFEDVPAGDWYVGNTTVAELRKKAKKRSRPMLPDQDSIRYDGRSLPQNAKGVPACGNGSLILVAVLWTA